MAEIDLTRARWIKSGRSGQDGACVQIAFVDGLVAVRDSKATAGSVLIFEATAWAEFLDGIRRGEFDHP